MRPFIALLWKDFRNLRWFIVFLFLTIPLAGVINAAGLILDRGFHVTDMHQPLYRWANDYSHAPAFILSVILVYSLTVELYSPSRHTALSLPVRRGLLML
ncbi:MAG: hypothetical protein ACYC9O_13300, partial [Candidatus Latescibacterota bacterium]